MYDIIIARGANSGEKFEIRTVKILDQFFKIRQDSEMSSLINQMNEAHTPFANSEIVSVKQRTGPTRKEGIPIEKIGAIIGDIELKDSNDEKCIKYYSNPLKAIHSVLIQALPLYSIKMVRYSRTLLALIY
jgi:hypothetical protein